MRRFALFGAALVVVLLVVAQLVLPGIAARELRDRLARSGRVVSVSVAAFPAIELLWHHAGKVDVHLASYRARTGTGLGRALDRTAHAGSINARIDTLNTGLVTLRDVTLRKRGDVLTGRAILTEADLQAALPDGLEVQPVASGDGKLVLQGTALGLSADATLSAVDGALQIAPDVPLIGGLFTITLFRDPHVDVQGVGASSAPGGFSVYASARLH
ncbi:MAG TPA: LmeA family phospholipid-binding protein [Solirubrobacteraceae bacterium]